MGRKTAEITIEAEGRDKGKKFLITEMSASAAERWGTRALLAMQKAGINVTVDPQSGMIGVAASGTGALVNLTFAEAVPLMEEMMQCVQARPSGAIVRSLIEEDIEEVATRLQLRRDVIELHLGFSIADWLRRKSAALMQESA